MNNPCDMPYKLPRRRVFEVVTDVLMDDVKIRKLYFTRVTAHDAHDAFSVCDKALLWKGNPLVFEVGV